MKSEDGMTTKTRRRYTEEFKAEAVRLVRDSARPVAQVARDLGIADHLLYRWRAEHRQAEGQGHTRHSLRAEQADVSADVISPQSTELRSPLNTESQCPFTAHQDGGGTDAAKGGFHGDSNISPTRALSL